MMCPMKPPHRTDFPIRSHGFSSGFPIDFPATFHATLSTSMPEWQGGADTEAVHEEVPKLGVPTEGWDFPGRWDNKNWEKCG